MNARVYSSTSLSKLILAVTFAALCMAPSILAQTSYKFDAATVSGLPARNIGSATMKRPHRGAGRSRTGRSHHGFRGAASGGVWKSVNGGTTYKSVFDRESVQSIERWRLIPLTRKLFGWAPVSLGRAIAFRLAMEFTVDDGGENWTNVGLKDTEHIAKSRSTQKMAHRSCMCHWPSVER